MNAMEWLTTERKIATDVLSRMGVRAMDHDQIGQVAAFPYLRDGKPYAAKFRKPNPKDWRSTQGVTRGLYNEAALSQMTDSPIVLTEGEMGALATMTAGWERSLSLPDGWTEDGGKRDILIDNEEAFRNSPFVIVAGDADKAGASLPREVASLLRGHDVREARWPKGCKDANDVLMRFGPEKLSECLTGARQIDPPGGFITGFSDLPALSERRVLRTGMQPFDQVVALQLSALSVWTGTPGSGKSTFLTWAAEKVSINENIRVGMFMFETHPHDLRDQLSLIRAGRDFRSLSESAQAKLLESLDDRYRVVHQTYGNTAHRLDWLEDMIWQLAVRDGCKLIIIDPWNELEHMPEPGESMTSYINWATKKLRQIAEQLEIHIALVAHPKKISEEWRAPTGYDVADSAAFFNKPSLGVTVHQRKDQETEEAWVDLIVWKVRNARLYGFQKSRQAIEFDPERQSYRKRSPKEDQRPPEISPAEAAGNSDGEDEGLPF